MRQWICLGIATFLMGIWSVAVAKPLSLAEIEACANLCLAPALAGQRPVADCIALAPATRKVVGPLARGLADAELEPITQVIIGLIQEQVNRYASDFVGSVLEVVTILPSGSKRYPHTYGVSGWVRRSKGADYQFTLNGFFYSASSCQAYTLAIENLSIVRWTRDQPAVVQIIKRITGQAP